MMRLASLSCVIALASSGALFGCGSAVVGGECADGYVSCDGRCVARDACGVHAAPTPTPSPTTSSDGGTDDAPPSGETSDGAIGADADHDGGGGPLGTGESIDGGGSRACDVPLSLCGSTCVDLSIDPFNCGACGNACPSGLCNGGKCRGAKAGHFVAVGHDFAGVARTSTAAQVAYASVFLPPKNPVRVLAFDAWADRTDGGAVDSVDAILGAGTGGRTWSMTRASSEVDVLSKLDVDTYDVLLVYDQPKAPDGALATLGSHLAAQLTSFGQAGGVVVVLDGGTGTAQMSDFLVDGGIVGVGDERNVGGLALENLAPGDAIGIDLLSSYLAPKQSVGFTLTEAASKDLVVVVDETTSGRAVVVHKVVRKP